MTENTKNINEVIEVETENTTIVEEETFDKEPEQPKKLGAAVKEGMSIIGRGIKDAVKRNRRKISIGAALVVGAGLTIAGAQLVNGKGQTCLDEELIDVTDTTEEVTDTNFGDDNYVSDNTEESENEEA